MLTKTLQKIIQDNIKKTFANLKLNLLGPDKISKAFVFSVKKFDPMTTLASIYLHANSSHSVTSKSVDKGAINQLKDVAENYVDNLEQKSLADITRIVSDKLKDIEVKAKIAGVTSETMLRGQEGRNLLKDIKTSLMVQKEKIDKAAELITNHELHNAQNFGAFDGLLSAAKSVGIKDPIVFKIGITDEKRCIFCKKLWSLSDGVTPKVYKLSELMGNPGNPKNPVASVSPTHPNCRDILSILMPNFGFNESGNITYIGKDHDEYKKQRG
jgi:hypothetical protein